MRAEIGVSGLVAKVLCFRRITYARYTMRRQPGASVSSGFPVANKPW